MTYAVLNYMKYNYHYWYAANLAAFLCIVIYSIFLNVIQFEGYNRLDICHPYFYQSQACRKRVAEKISENLDFQQLKKTYSTEVYNKKTSLIDQVNTMDSDIHNKENTVFDKFVDLVNQLEKLGSSYLGNFQKLEKERKQNDPPSVLTQLKTVLDRAIVEPTMTKYVDPLTRLYTKLATPSPK